jgi:hypothetical protein
VSVVNHGAGLSCSCSARLGFNAGVLSADVLHDVAKLVAPRLFPHGVKKLVKDERGHGARNMLVGGAWKLQNGG